MWDCASTSKAHPSVSWIIVINPDSGPTLDPTDPSMYCVPTLRSVLSPSSIFVGYVRTGYNDRPLDEIKADVESYASWKKIKVQGSRKTAPLDGIFFDETSDTTTKRLQGFASIAKTAFSNRLVKVRPDKEPKNPSHPSHADICFALM